MRQRADAGPKQGHVAMRRTWLHAARPLQLTFRPFAILARSSSASSLLLSSSSACPMQPKPPDDDGADSNCTRHALGATIFSTAADTSASHTPWRRPTKSSVVCISGCGSSSCPIRKVKTTSPPKMAGPAGVEACYCRYFMPVGCLLLALPKRCPASEWEGVFSGVFY